MTGNYIETVYWDTCIFYALLKGENNHGGEIAEAIKSAFDSFLQGKLKIVTSTITIAEVARGHFESEEPLKKFKSLKFVNNFEFVPPIFPIMETASEIKDYYYNNPLGKNGRFNLVNVADAIHLATAIRHEVDAFITLDGKNKTKTREIGLLKLESPLAEKYNLTMLKPKLPAQKDMFS